MSITLTTPTTINLDGVTAETDNNAAVTYFEMSYPDSLRVFIGRGNTAGQVFTPGAIPPKVIVTINLFTGVWSSSTGASGTISGAGLTNAQNVALNIRNTLESFAAAQNLVVGSAVAWTTGMFQ